MSEQTKQRLSLATRITTRSTVKSTREPGQVLGILTLIGPRGNPEHGAALYWDVRCNVCGREWAIMTREIGQRGGQKYCSQQCVNVHKHGKAPAAGNL